MNSSTSNVDNKQDASSTDPPSQPLKSFHDFNQWFHTKVWGDTKWAQSFHDKVWGHKDKANVDSESNTNEK